MKSTSTIVSGLIFLSSLTFNVTSAETQRVTLLRTPDGGIQPQAAVDQKGTVHLIYYKGDAGAGDIFYVHRQVNESEFSKPIRVNSQSGSAIAAGSIRGAQLAVGKNGRVHVAWDGMGKGAKEVAFNDKKVTPLFYTRSNDDGSGFEPERNVITYAFGLDGGSSVAADLEGNVYVAWHGRAPESPEGEAGRAVFVARSKDEGQTFGREALAVSKATGACACCGMRAFADKSSAVYILFRGASEQVNRDEILLISPRPGAEFQIANSHPWNIATCPMSSATLTEGKEGVLAAWETAGQVYFAAIKPKTMQVSKPIAPPGSAKRKHPVAVGNGKGETLFAWTEGTGWSKGGAVAWQLFDEERNALSESGRSDGVPMWSLPTAFAKADGSFVLVY